MLNPVGYLGFENRPRIKKHNSPCIYKNFLYLLTKILYPSAQYPALDSEVFSYSGTLMPYSIFIYWHCSRNDVFCTEFFGSPVIVHLYLRGQMPASNFNAFAAACGYSCSCLTLRMWYAPLPVVPLLQPCPTVDPPETWPAIFFRRPTVAAVVDSLLIRHYRTIGRP
jgi:hypothetical protein